MQNIRLLIMSLINVFEGLRITVAKEEEKQRYSGQNIKNHN